MRTHVMLAAAGSAVMLTLAACDRDTTAQARAAITASIKTENHLTVKRA